MSTVFHASKLTIHILWHLPYFVVFFFIPWLDMKLFVCARGLFCFDWIHRRWNGFSAQHEYQHLTDFEQLIQQQQQNGIHKKASYNDNIFGEHLHISLHVNPNKRFAYIWFWWKLENILTFSFCCFKGDLCGFGEIPNLKMKMKMNIVIYLEHMVKNLR